MHKHKPLNFLEWTCFVGAVFFVTGLIELLTHPLLAILVMACGALLIVLAEVQLDKKDAEEETEK